ncbi:Gustatory receptor 14 [Operophtera brumata]|uniref:Gustatory receptor 14 n=1 Tax=Operophtera brumata TaxID=104452 RepID=A0A0L7KTH4_OPEBR|nr:Gustatory receptor 14 [Operophtera brumata]
MLMLTIMPAISAGMLTTQANNIQARPCRFRVWKVIPLDADLLGMVLSFCVTYLIVIIQFTNK